MRVRVLLVSLSALALFSIAVLVPHNAHALSASEFQAGRIMDDSVFFNSGSMSANDIQAFLNGKVPACDTNGNQPYGSTTRRAYATSKGYPPPYTCLKDYVQSTSVIAGEAGLCSGFSGGNKSAAQIIQEVSVSCGINPRVLLVLLQKEQSFITDDWPWSIQYQKATGYACPDTAACNPAYAGFFKQMYYGARQFKNYSLNESSFRYRAGRDNFIQYHPSTACGGSNIFLQNQATAGLYNYTPYQPNGAALNNLYGTGDGCSAYGNRNFWRMYNDWFGPTLGPLIRSLTNATLYYTDGTSRYIVPSMSIASQYGLSLRDVRYMHQQEVNAIPLTNSPNTKNLSQLVKSDSDSDADGGALYLVSAGKKLQIQSMQQLADMSFNTNQISYMALSNLYRLPNGGPLRNFLHAPSNYVYKIEAGKKRVVFSPSTLKSINPAGYLSNLSEYTLTTIGSGQPYVVGDAVLRAPNGKMWLYLEGQWHYLPALSSYDCWKFSNLPNLRFLSYNQVEVNQTPNSLRCSVQRSDGAKYLMNSVNKINVQPGWGLGSFSTPLDRTIDRLGAVSVAPGSIFKSPATKGLYLLEGGRKRQIYSMDDFVRLGYNPSSIVSVDSGLMNSIGNGAAKVGSGTVLRKSDGTLYLTNGSGKLHIPSMNVYNAFGLSRSKHVSANQTMLDAYADQGMLLTKFWAGGRAILADSGTRFVVTDSNKLPAGYTSPNSPSYSLWVTASLVREQELTRFIKATNSNSVYYLDNGQKRPINSWARLQSLGGNGSSIKTLSPFTTALFPTGSNM
jgi:hypothetical protein